MDRHFLDAEHYCCPKTFEKEQKNIFSKLWLFAGFTFMVADRNQFFTRTLSGVSVLVQRTDAGVRAFVNECPHRLSPIQTQAMGKRPLVCPYHAWTFGSEGELRGIPHAQIYGFDAPEREKICLKKLPIHTVGPLIFISLDINPTLFTEQFSSDFLQEIEEVCDHLDHEMIYSSHAVRYNWKLVMENVKDFNHVSFVHPKSFSPVVKPLDYQAPDAHTVNAVFNPVNPHHHPPLRELSFAAKHPMTPGQPWFAQHCELYADEENYCNWYLYPNVNFTSVKGALFTLQQYEPVSPTETICHLWIMTARRKPTAPDFTALLAALMRADRAVIAEDTELLEKMQSGLGTHSGQYRHGHYEIPLVKHHRWYRAHVLEQEI